MEVELELPLELESGMATETETQMGGHVNGEIKRHTARVHQTP